MRANLYFREKKNTVRQKQTSHNIEGGKCVFKPEENGQI